MSDFCEMDFYDCIEEAEIQEYGEDFPDILLELEDDLKKRRQLEDRMRLIFGIPLTVSGVFIRYV